MSKREKLIQRFIKIPSDFKYAELITLLNYFGYTEKPTGKTGGSRVRFVNELGITIGLHKPHPTDIVKKVYLKEIKEKLEL